MRTYLPQGRILHATVSRETDRWFVSFTVEEEIPDPLPPRGPAAGIDVGLESYATIVDERGFGKLERLSRSGRHFVA
ncbi:hypothetical protein [Brockia lithotrophica]|uniref:hypothetical protein n=1 Tax=Brockia lithotrophica TaxID=933949 RepID=UPI001FE3E24F|nr:hypothetical protein [Brockia lithotrophica]